MSFWDTATRRNVFVVTDFDKTLTTGSHKGLKSPSTIAIYRNANLLSPEYVAAAHALADEYLPIEKDPQVSITNKLPKMQEWWEKHLQLFLQYGMHKKFISQALDSDMLAFRKSIGTFFSLLADVPVLVFSAGNGNFIEAFLKQNTYLTSNIHIHSNFFEFGENGTAVGYKGEIITSVNKNHVYEGSAAFSKEVQGRTHMILLGDSVSDIGMGEHFSPTKTFTIGFCNESSQLNAFKKTFDLVIPDDGSFEAVNILLSQIKN